MDLLRRLLLLPLLAPLMAALLVGGLNPNPRLALRLLTWTSPSLPLGAWIAGMAAGGAVLSSGATALALRGTGDSLRRRVRREEADDRQDWERAAEAPPRRREPPASWARSEDQPSGRPADWRTVASAGPGREPGQPTPTLSVPFRVIRRPVSTSSGPSADQASARPQAGREREPEPVPAWDDGWGNDTLEEW
ncbi:MAG: LapA family protein [Cyanobium sp.]